MTYAPYSVPEIRGKDRVNSINEYLNNNIGQNPYCPAGYRLPNLREMAVLRDFMPAVDRRTYITSNMVSRTYGSFGIIGKYYNPSRVGIDTRYGWGCSHEKVFMLRTANETTSTVRCVQDVKDGNWNGD